MEPRLHYASKLSRPNFMLEKIQNMKKKKKKTEMGLVDLGRYPDNSVIE